MTVTILEILQNVLKILYIGKDVHKLVLYHGISSVIKLLDATYEAYQSLVDKEHCKLFIVYQY